MIRMMAAALGLTVAACATAPEAPPPPPRAEAPVQPAPAPQEAPAPAPIADEALQSFAAAAAPRLARARYMERNCTPTTFPGWEGFPLVRCAYEMRNRDGTRLSAEVVMLNPDATQLARWVFTACRRIGRDAPPCRDRLLAQVIGQSGGQFPVAGVVLEDLNEDGAFENYSFREGLTVKLAGVPNGGTAQLTPAQMTLALSPDTVITSARRFARIQGTSPDEYRANGGSEDVGTTQAPSLLWPQVVGRLYRKAWGADEYELMTAWARANPNKL